MTKTHQLEVLTWRLKFLGGFNFQVDGHFTVPPYHVLFSEVSRNLGAVLAWETPRFPDMISYF